MSAYIDSCVRKEDGAMPIICTKTMRLTFDDRASFTSLTIDGEEMLAPRGNIRPLFRLRLRGGDGAPLETTNRDFSSVQIREASECGYAFSFSGHSSLGLTVTVQVLSDEEEDSASFYASVQNRTDYWVEWIDFPDVTVKNDFAGTGGTGRLFWPIAEGCLVDDPGLRDRTPFAWQSMEYPSRGWEGYYPGPVPMQFMAYYTEHAGFYLAAHDPHHTPKSIEYRSVEGGVRMEYRLYLSGRPQADCETGFPLVLKAGVRDWTDAAGFYRAFVESAYLLPPKTWENPDLPEWYRDSPIVVSYPVRGEKDTGQMEPNSFFPYEKALPVVDRLAEETGARILVLLMHWEGTAPWAPPYVWPPFGGEEAFESFLEQLHEKGNLLGVYASGLGWTNVSNLWQEYNMEARYRRENLAAVMCTAPDQSVPNAVICNGPIRWGHDMCISQYFTRKTAVEEVLKTAASGVDYIQYFDQTLGGHPCLCYGKDHGHPPVPGLWATESMKALNREIRRRLEEKGLQTVIGTECAASEAYLPWLLFSDLRYNLNYSYGRPVPAYSFVFHEYLVNFMGNQNGFNKVVPCEKNPYSLHYRLAYSFAAGDLLTVMLTGEGKLFWDWGTPWSVPPPEQKSLLTLLHNLTTARKGVAYPYLQEGRMLPPNPCQTELFELIRQDGSKIVFPDVISTAWEGRDGTRAQIFVNFMPGDKEATVELDGGKLLTVTVPEFDCRVVELG